MRWCASVPACTAPMRNGGHDVMGSQPDETQNHPVPPCRRGLSPHALGGEPASRNSSVSRASIFWTPAFAGVTNRCCR
jgi:hypothetical protein